MAQTWFADPELAVTNFSVSSVCNNLSKEGDVLVYAHLDDVIYVNSSRTPSDVRKLPSLEKSFVHQVRICVLQDIAFIVVASDNGVQILDATGENIVYEIALKDMVDASEDGLALFCRGICAIHLSSPLIMIGTSQGKCFVVGKERSSKSASPHEFDLLETLSDHKDPICCIDSSKDGLLAAVSDASGTILVRHPDENFEIMHRIMGNEYPATSLRFTADKWLVVGYLTGKLRFYHKDNFRLHSEVAAHSRAITALDVNEHCIVSVAEDTFMNVWELTTAKTGTPRVKLVSSQPIPNDMLVGVAFAGDKSVITASYDTNHLKLWLPE